MGFNSFIPVPPTTGPAGPSVVNAVPTGAYSVVTAGADPSGGLDSSGAIAAAIDTVVNNNGTYQTVWFPTGTYKMLTQVTKLGIASGITLNLQGGGNVLLNFTSLVDQCVLYLGGGLGASLAYGSALDAVTPIVAGDQTIKLAAGGVAALGLVPGDKMLITTQPFADTKSTTGTTTNGSNTVTAVATVANIADGEVIKTYPNNFPQGTTVVSHTANTYVCSRPAFASGSGIPVFSPSTNWLFNTYRPTYYKGEMVTIPLATEATAPAPINGQVITLKRNAYDSYTVANTTIYKLKMPRISIDGINFQRTNNGVTGKFGYRVEFCSPGIINNCNGQGAASTIFYCDAWDGGAITNNFGQDFWFSGITNGYGIASYGQQDVTIFNNRMFGGRHAITLNGNLAVGRGINAIKNYVSNVDSAASSFDSHDSVELCNIEGNFVYDGMGLSCANSRVVNNLIESRATEGLAILLTKSMDYMIVRGNSVSVINPGIDGIGIKASLNDIVTVAHVDVSDNDVRSTSAGIRIYSTQSYNTGLTIDRLTLTNNDAVVTATAGNEALQIARTKSVPSTSVTSLSIATGSTVFTLVTGVAANLFYVGQRMRAQRAGANSASFMEGLVTATATAPERVTINVDVVGNNGAGPFTDWDLTLNSDITINSLEIIGGRYLSNSTIVDGATIQAHWNTGRFRATGTQFVNGKNSGSPINGLAGFSFKDFYFEDCYFGAIGAGLGDNRGLIFWNPGTVSFTDCEWDTFSRHQGIFATGITAGIDAPTQIIVNNPKYTGTVVGIISVPATTGIVERRPSGLPVVGADWVASGGWGGTAVVTCAGNSYCGVVTVTTQAGDATGANPTLTLTIKDRGYSRAPVAVVDFDSTSTGPTPTPGLLVTPLSVNTVQTVAGGVNTNSTSKMLITYQGTPTTLSSKTYKFHYRVDL